jgi:hypothetical protein
LGGYRAVQSKAEQCEEDKGEFVHSVGE